MEIDFASMRDTVPTPINTAVSLHFVWINGKTYIVNINNSESIFNLKLELLQKIFMDGIIAMFDDIRFIHGGKQLVDTKLIHEYGLENNDTIHCVLRLRGAGEELLNGRLLPIDSFGATGSAPIRF